MDNPSIPLEELQRRFANVANKLPKIAANEVVNFALDNFKRQGFMGDSFQPWAKRKKQNWKIKSKRAGRNILIDSGRLRRSIRVIKEGWSGIVVGSDVPYAKAHNEGENKIITQQVKAFSRNITTVGVVKKIERKTKTNVQFGRVKTGTSLVKDHSRQIHQNIPARPFLGNSSELNKRLQEVIADTIMKAVQP